MKNIFHVEHAAINMMDRVVDPKLGWHEGGSDIRRVMLKAINSAYKAGRRAERVRAKQERCNHAFTYHRTGGVCRLCGAETLQCSSD